MLVNFGVESSRLQLRTHNAHSTDHFALEIGSITKMTKRTIFGNQNQNSNVILRVCLVDFVSRVFFVELFMVHAQLT